MKIIFTRNMLAKLKHIFFKYIIHIRIVEFTYLLTYLHIYFFQIFETILSRARYKEAKKSHATLISTLNKFNDLILPSILARAM